VGANRVDGGARCGRRRGVRGGGVCGVGRAAKAGVGVPTRSLGGDLCEVYA